MSTRIPLSAALWQQHLQAQVHSGLSQADYCHQHGLSVHSFRARKYRQTSRHPSAAIAEGHSGAPAQSWIELPLGLGTTPSPGWQIELDLGNGVCLRLRQG